MKILNLYACLGGNRYKWDEAAKEAGIEIEVTAVELDPEAAKLYQERFLNVSGSEVVGQTKGDNTTLAHQTNVILVVSALIIAVALISKK
jgi:hypothetical protein